ncbi:hypothetical protein QMZ05_24555 [Bradyrhizobium sp. INPA03-11B]|uniref:hypothetical protein n=1 Tax=Bradyrhizobium sp. INPA03-11B TaxID=418598 RepID=UPI00338D7F66
MFSVVKVTRQFMLGKPIVSRDDLLQGAAMTAVALRARRPIDVARLLIALGLIGAFVAVLATDIRKECRAGAFSSGFSRGFDVGHCEYVIRALGTEVRWRVD